MLPTINEGMQPQFPIVDRNSFPFPKTSVVAVTAERYCGDIF